MINISTGEEEEMILSLSEREKILATGEWTQKLSTAQFISQHGSLLSKTDNGWKDVLHKVKSGSAKKNSVNL
jgi:hypothetical protein|tara:strand:+ start:1601 stop:1816 length:216 start_codon:yes stop_codon:yes gene_type:complete